MKNFLRASPFLLLLLTAGAAFPQEQGSNALSPDGRYVCKFNEDDGETTFGVYSRKTDRLLLKPPEGSVNSFTRQLSWVWSPDSARVALNYRAGGRYNTTSVFKRRGESFVETPSFEELLAAELEKEKDTNRRDQGIGKDAYQRRIWDSFTVTRWIDDNTIEVEAYSIRSVALGADDATDVSAGMRFRLRETPNGAWSVVRQERAPLDELAGEKSD